MPENHAAASIATTGTVPMKCGHCAPTAAVRICRSEGPVQTIGGDDYPNRIRQSPIVPAGSLEPVVLLRLAGVTPAAAPEDRSSRDRHRGRQNTDWKRATT